MEALEAFSDALQPYKEIVGQVTSVVTVGQMFSGTFMCWGIYKQGNTKGVPLSAFMGGLAMGILQLQFGLILRDETMTRTNVFGIALSIVYVSIFFAYTKEKAKAWKQTTLWGAFAAAAISYAQFGDQEEVASKFGLFILVLMAYMILSPFFGLVANKSTEDMPLPMIVSGAAVTTCWLLYGIILKNYFIVIQNLIISSLCWIQLSLFFIVPKKPEVKSKAKAKKAD